MSIKDTNQFKRISKELETVCITFNLTSDDTTNDTGNQDKSMSIKCY